MLKKHIPGACIFVLLFSILSCEYTDKSGEQEAAIEGEVRLTNWPNGNKRTEISYNNDKKNGWSYSYDKNGNLFQKVFYKDDLKNGEAFIYHSNGKIRQKSNYFNNKLNGKRLKYYRDGSLSSKQTFVNSNPCFDLVEYLLDGSVKKNNPKLLIKEINRILLDGTFHLRISISGEFRSVVFYLAEGQLKDCTDLSLLPEISDTKKNSNYVELKYSVPPGTFRMEEIYVVAKVNTRKGNPLIIQKKYNLAVDNR